MSHLLVFIDMINSQDKMVLWFYGLRVYKCSEQQAAWGEVEMPGRERENMRGGGDKVENGQGGREP